MDGNKFGLDEAVYQEALSEIRAVTPGLEEILFERVLFKALEEHALHEPQIPTTETVSSVYAKITDDRLRTRRTNTALQHARNGFIFAKDQHHEKLLKILTGDNEISVHTARDIIEEYILTK